MTPLFGKARVFGAQIAAKTGPQGTQQEAEDLDTPGSKHSKSTPGKQAKSTPGKGNTPGKQNQKQKQTLDRQTSSGSMDVDEVMAESESVNGTDGGVPNRHLTGQDDLKANAQMEDALEIFAVPP